MNKIEDGLELRTTHFGLVRMSRDYINAFRIIQERNDKITFLFSVKFYLLAHSIELSLKAYLRFKGYKVTDLKKLGHSLTRIYRELSSKFDYKLDEKPFAYIKIIDPYYKNKQFEYPVTGYKDVIELKDLEIITDMINTSTEWQIHTEKNLKCLEVEGKHC